MLWRNGDLLDEERREVGLELWRCVRMCSELRFSDVQSGLVASSIFALLRADRRFCESVATAEQAAASHGVSVGKLTGRDARWMDGKVDLVGPEFAATWGGSAEEKVEARRVESYSDAARRRMWDE